MEGKSMEFEINGSKWTIETVNEDRMNNLNKRDDVLGLTDFQTQEIFVLDAQANIVRTLKHELMHCWMWEYGHIQSDDRTYTFEEICDMVSASNGFINNIVNLYCKVRNGNT